MLSPSQEAYNHQISQLDKTLKDAREEFIRQTKLGNIESAQKKFTEVTEIVLTQLAGMAQQEMGQPPFKFELIAVGSSAYGLSLFSDIDLVILADTTDSESIKYSCSLLEKLNEYLIKLSQSQIADSRNIFLPAGLRIDLGDITFMKHLKTLNTPKQMAANVYMLLNKIQKQKPLLDEDTVLLGGLFLSKSIYSSHENSILYDSFKKLMSQYMTYKLQAKYIDQQNNVHAYHDQWNTIFASIFLQEQKIEYNKMKQAYILQINKPGEEINLKKTFIGPMAHFIKALAIYFNASTISNDNTRFSMTDIIDKILNSKHEWVEQHKESFINLRNDWLFLQELRVGLHEQYQVNHDDFLTPNTIIEPKHKITVIVDQNTINKDLVVFTPEQMGRLNSIHINFSSLYTQMNAEAAEKLSYASNPSNASSPSSSNRKSVFGFFQTLLTKSPEPESSSKHTLKK